MGLYVQLRLIGTELLKSSRVSGKHAVRIKARVPDISAPLILISAQRVAVHATTHQFAIHLGEAYICSGQFAVRTDQPFCAVRGPLAIKAGRELHILRTGRLRIPLVRRRGGLQGSLLTLGHQFCLVFCLSFSLQAHLLLHLRAGLGISSLDNVPSKCTPAS